MCNKPEEHTLSADVSKEMADWHIGPLYNSANKHNGLVEELLFHTQEIPGSILGLEVANLKLIYGFRQSFHENGRITYQNRV